MKRMRCMALLALTSTTASLAGTALAAGGADDKSSFDTLNGWHIRPFPAVQMLRMGVTRRTGSMADNPDFTWDVLQSVGFGVSFNPPWRHLRSHVYDSQGRETQRQWLGFSILSILKGGTESKEKRMLENAEIGFGASLDFLELISLGVGIDLYRGVSVGDTLYHTGLLPRLFGAGHLTAEDIYVSLSLNLRTTLFGGTSGTNTSGEKK